MNRMEEEISEVVQRTSAPVAVARGMATGALIPKIAGSAINAVATFLHQGAAESGLSMKWYLAKSHTLLPGYYESPANWLLVTSKPLSVYADASKVPYTVNLSGVMPALAGYDQVDCRLELVRSSDGSTLLGKWFDDIYNVPSANYDSLDATFS